MRDQKVSLRGKLVRDMMRNMMDSAMGHKFQTGEFRMNPVEPAWICPPDFEYEIVEMDAFKMEYLRPSAVCTGRVILQIHGGGYIGPMKNTYRDFAVQYSRRSLGGDVLTVDYRVAPEHPYPAALEDAVCAYEWLLAQGWFSEQIIVAGDSAGGGLAMALCHYLSNHGRQLPCGIIAMSPWTDLTASGESYDTNYERDPMFGKTRDSLIYNRDYVGDHDPMDEYISPMFGDFRGFPPMLIQVGSYEMLLSDSVDVAAKARGQGVKVRLSIYDGMFHIFQMAAKMLPESRKAWVEIGKFIEILLRE